MALWSVTVSGIAVEHCGRAYRLENVTVWEIQSNETEQSVWEGDTALVLTLCVHFSCEVPTMAGQ
jgi:hypothetical protein